MTSGIKHILAPAKTFDLSGLVCVVTGGGRGIGRWITEGLASAGAEVVICGRSEATLKDAQKEMRAAGLDITAFVADVAREEDVVELSSAIIAAHGKIDVLVNNAGVNPIYKGIEKTSLEEWRQILDVNLTGMFLCCKYLGGAMAERGAGSIINVTSVAGHVGMKKSLPYCASKGGGELLTKALALDWASKGVRVNALAPAFFETELTEAVRNHDTISAELLAHTPLGRFGSRPDVAGAAVFLASPASAYMTGQSLVIDGGWTAD